MDSQIEEESEDRGHEAIARILCLLRLLGCGSAVTRAEIFDHPLLRDFYRARSEGDNEKQRKARGRAERMLRRDLQCLREQGYKIRIEWAASKAYARYSLDRAAGPAPIFFFDQSDLEVLLFLHALFEDPIRFNRREPSQSAGHPFSGQIQGLVERLAAALPQEQLAYFNRWVQRPRVFFNVGAFEDYSEHRGTIAWLSEAIAARRQIQFVYRPLHQVQEEKRYQEIDPYELFFENGHMYLLAYHHLKGRVVEFRINRIRGESLEYYGNRLIDAVHRSQAVTFTFLIHSDLAKHGLSQKWLSQEIIGEEETLDEDGRTVQWTRVRAAAASELRIIQNILKYGQQAVLLEPPSLVERMRSTVERMARSYASLPVPG